MLVIYIQINFFIGFFIKGNKKAIKGIGTERVLESGPHDTVFLNFADHGGPGVNMYKLKFVIIKIIFSS